MTRDFETFYAGAYLADHRHPGNVGLHLVGVVLGLATLVAAFGLAIGIDWRWGLLVIAFPPIHAAPGLIGHRLFERDAAVGDLRLTRTDWPLAWFIRANHRLAWRILRRRASPA